MTPSFQPNDSGVSEVPSIGCTLRFSTIRPHPRIDTDVIARIAEDTIGPVSVAFTSKKDEVNNEPMVQVVMETQTDRVRVDNLFEFDARIIDKIHERVLNLVREEEFDARDGGVPDKFSEIVSTNRSLAIKGNMMESTERPVQSTPFVVAKLSGVVSDGQLEDIINKRIELDIARVFALQNGLFAIEKGSMHVDDVREIIDILEDVRRADRSEQLVKCLTFEVSLQ